MACLLATEQIYLSRSIGQFYSGGFCLVVRGYFDPNNSPVHARSSPRQPFNVVLLYLGPKPKKQIEVRSSWLARVTSKHDNRFYMAKFLVGAALEEFINPSMSIDDSISLVVVFCIGSQCVFVILVISIRWFQNVSICFQICSMICSHSPPTYLWITIKLFQRSLCFRLFLQCVSVDLRSTYQWSAMIPRLFFFDSQSISMILDV